MNIAEATARLHRIYQADPASAPARDSDYEPLWGPVVLCGAIPCDNFLCLLESEDDADELRWEYEPYGSYGMGRVIIHSLTTVVHKRVASAIVQAIREQLMLLGDDPTLEDALRRPASLACQLRTRLQAPDDALVPAEAPKASLPTLVIEVAFLNETLEALKMRLSRWMTESGSVQVAVGVKVCANARRTVVLMQRGAPTQLIDFGGRGRVSHASSLATFPLHLLFEGFKLPIALWGRERQLIVVDADHLRVVVQKALRLMRRQGVVRLR